jgi:hypothetical protein
MRETSNGDGGPSGPDDSPKFGRLVVVLVLALALLVAIMFGAQAYFS